ncbi:MAG: RNA polymerase sigma factor [Calditrichaeota bacterium]|nr:RNA polymerase sigma factor [Candidatus Cloacimonadota bacterium]MCB1046586.1 RNA polymerase sigma factor [Calditrichota bacterium]MCB9475053.1 RNA polymerase sigma factor [Candidatus Delongbacteria bacterium]
MDEQTLISLAQNGDAAAFESLLKRYDERIMGLIMGFVKNRNDAQDVYQEVFLRVWTSLPRFRQESSFFTWVYRIAVNRCISLCEQRTRRDKLHVQPRTGDDDEDGDWLDRLAVADDGREEEERQDRLERIWRCAGDLNSRQQMVLTLRFRHGLKLKDIAEILEMPEGTVKILTFRAVRRIRQQLEEAPS